MFPETVVCIRSVARSVCSVLSMSAVGFWFGHYADKIKQFQKQVESIAQCAARISAWQFFEVKCMQACMQACVHNYMLTHTYTCLHIDRQTDRQPERVKIELRVDLLDEVMIIRISQHTKPISPVIT